MLDFNRDTYAFWLAKAVTDVKELVIGRTYYSNYKTWNKFVIKDILTNRDYFTRLKDVHNILRFEREGRDLDTPYWIVAENGKQFALADFGIGKSFDILRSYSPWLVFADEKDVIQCQEQLIIFEDVRVHFNVRNS